MADSGTISAQSSSNPSGIINTVKVDHAQNEFSVILNKVSDATSKAISDFRGFAQQAIGDLNTKHPDTGYSVQTEVKNGVEHLNISIAGGDFHKAVTALHSALGTNAPASQLASAGASNLYSQSEGMKIG